MNKPITYSLFVLIFLFISNIGYALSVSPREPNSPLISKNSMTADSLEFFGLKFQNNGTTKIMFDSVASNAQYHLKIYS